MAFWYRAGTRTTTYIDFLGQTHTATAPDVPPGVDFACMLSPGGGGPRPWAIKARTAFPDVPPNGENYVAVTEGAGRAFVLANGYTQEQVDGWGEIGAALR